MLLKLMEKLGSFLIAELYQFLSKTKCCELREFPGEKGCFRVIRYNDPLPGKKNLAKKCVKFADFIFLAYDCCPRV